MSPPKAVRPALYRNVWLSKHRGIARSFSNQKYIQWYIFSSLSFRRKHGICNVRSLATGAHKELLYPSHTPALSSHQPYNVDKCVSQPLHNNHIKLNAFIRLAIYDDLKREADIFCLSKEKNSLVDTKAHKDSVSLWLLLFQYRKRLHGYYGVLDVWKGLRARKIDLPTSGRVAETLWKTLISAGLSSKRDAKAIFGYAVNLYQRTGHCYQGIYEDAIGFCLRNKPKDALVWHRVLRKSLPVPSGSLKRLSVLAARNKKSLDAFRSIYSLSEEHDVHDDLMGSSQAVGEHTPVYSRRKNPLLRGDELLNVAQNYEISHIEQRKQNEVELRSRSEMEDYSGSNDDVQYSCLPREIWLPSDDVDQNNSRQSSLQSPSHIAGRESGPMKFRTMNDMLCARLLATRSIPLGFLLEVFTAAGVKEMSPMALRQLAIRLTDIESITDGLSQLKEKGIKYDESTFGRVLEIFVLRKQSKLLMNTMNSDLHPDTYEDSSIQHRLLIWYLKNRRWIEAHRALEVMASEHGTDERHSWNLLFQYYIRKSANLNWRRFLAHMRVNQIDPTPDTLLYMLKYKLAPRQESKTASSSTRVPDGTLSTLARLCIEFIDNRYSTSLRMWREILKRFGMAGRMDELAYLSVRLVQLSLSDNVSEEKLVLHELKPVTFPSASPYTLPRQSPSTCEAGLCKDLFDVPMISAIISWGFISGSKQGSLHEKPQWLRDSFMEYKSQYKSSNMLKNIMSTEKYSHHYFGSSTKVPAWVKGVELVANLKSMGVSVNPNVVKKSLRQRLWILYGPGISLKKRNRKLKNVNTMSLIESLQWINAVWGSPLFDYESLFQVNSKMASIQNVTSFNAEMAEGAATLKVIETPEIGQIRLGEESLAAKREKLLVLVFSEKRSISKAEKRSISIRGWAQLLEKNGDFAWIGL